LLKENCSLFLGLPPLTNILEKPSCKLTTQHNWIKKESVMRVPESLGSALVQWPGAAVPQGLSATRWEQANGLCLGGILNSLSTEILLQPSAKK